MAGKRNGGVIEYPLDNGDVSYRIQYRDASGRQIKETLGRSSEGWTRTLAKAERKERAAKSAKGFRRPDPVLFSNYAPKWFESAQVERNWSDGTRTKYQTAVNRLTDEFGNVKLRDLTAVMVNDYKARLLSEVGAGVVNLTLTVLGMILDKAEEDNLIEQGRRPRVSRPKIPSYKPRALSAVEARAVEAELGKHPNPQMRLAFLTFELIGLRRKELLGLRWRDINFDAQTLRIEESKTQAGERSHYVPDYLLNELQAHYARSPFKRSDNRVFTNSVGDPWRLDHGYYDAIKDALSAVGIHEKFRPAHDLRVTNLTEGALAGESPAILMARAGHKSFATTKRYLDLAGIVFEDEARKLAERRLGGLRLVEGGKAEEASVQEAR